MSKVRVSAFAVSLDGYSAGPRQSLDNPLGVRGPELFEWFFSTRTWKQMHGQEGGSTGIDNEWARRGMENVGAWTDRMTGTWRLIAGELCLSEYFRVADDPEAVRKLADKPSSEWPSRLRECNLPISDTLSDTGRRRWSVSPQFMSA